VLERGELPSTIPSPGEQRLDGIARRRWTRGAAHDGSAARVHQRHVRRQEVHERYLANQARTLEPRVEQRLMSGDAERNLFLVGASAAVVLAGFGTVISGQPGDRLDGDALASAVRGWSCPKPSRDATDASRAIARTNTILLEATSKQHEKRASLRYAAVQSIRESTGGVGDQVLGTHNLFAA